MNDDESLYITDNPENESTAIDMVVPSQSSESEVQSNTGSNGGTQTVTDLGTASVPSTSGRFQAVLIGEADFVDAFSQETVSISNVASAVPEAPELARCPLASKSAKRQRLHIPRSGMIRRVIQSYIIL